ncbi:MAG: hypothetical protein ACHQUC_08925 [Chlamydiales bacterium]
MHIIFNSRPLLQNLEQDLDFQEKPNLSPSDTGSSSSDELTLSQTGSSNSFSDDDTPAGLQPLLPLAVDSREKIKSPSLPVKMQITLLMRLFKDNESTFSSLTNYAEYTPRQLLALELIRLYKEHHRFKLFNLLNCIFNLNEEALAAIQNERSLAEHPCYKVLARQTALLDIPINKINHDLNIENLTISQSVNHACMMHLSGEVATQMKLRVKQLLEAISKFSQKLEQEHKEKQQEAAKSIKKIIGKRMVIVAPNKITSPELEFLKESIKQLDHLCVKGRRQSLRCLDQIAEKSRTEIRIGIQPASIIEFQLDKFSNCTQSIVQDIDQLSEGFTAINELVSLLEGMVSKISVSDLSTVINLQQKKDCTNSIKLKLAELSAVVKTFCGTYRGYMERFQQQTSLRSSEELYYPTEKFALSPEELEQIEIERAHSLGDSDSDSEESPRSLSTTSSSSSSIDPIPAKDKRVASGKKKKGTCKKRGAASRPSNHAKIAQANSFSEIDLSTAPTASTLKAQKIMGFREVSLSYACAWEAAMKRFVQHQQSKLTTPYFKARVEQCKNESIQHLHYSFVGFELLQEAIRKGNGAMLGEVLPVFILDLAIQIEQTMALYHVAKNKPRNMDHDLVLLANLTSIDEQLSPKTREHLNQISHAMIWARYPVSSKRYFVEKEREYPLALKLILQSQQLMRNKESTREQYASLMTNLMALYKDHIAASAEILSLLSESQSLHLITTEMLPVIDEAQEQMLSQIETLTESEPSDADSSEINALSELEGQLKEIYKAAKKKSDVKILKIKSKINETVNHLNRLKQVLKIYHAQSPAHHQAWTFRNYLKVQQVLEGLYQIRMLLRGHSDQWTHHLHDYHSFLQDSEEMSETSLFDFGKQLHYSQRADSHHLAVPFIEHLHHLEDRMRSENNGGFTLVSKHQNREQMVRPVEETADLMPQAINSSLSVIAMQIDACRREF